MQARSKIKFAHALDAKMFLRERGAMKVFFDAYSKNSLTRRKMDEEIF